MKMLKINIKRHWLMLVVVLMLGFYNYLPHWLYQNNLGGDYRGITKSFANDDLYYLARGQEVLDNHPLLASPCFAEHKNGTPMQFWLPDWLLAKPLALLNINVVSGYAFYSFLLPALVAMLTYFAVYNVIGSRKLALAGALIFNALLFFGSFVRLPSPGLNFIFWLTLFNLLIKYLKEDRTVWLILATLNLGLLFYVYPYYWTFYYVMLVLLMIFGKIWLRNFKIKNYVLLLSGGLIIGSRYFWELFQGFKSPAYQDAMARLGLLSTRFPSGLKIVVLALILSGLLFWLLKKKIIPLNPLFVLLFSGTVAAGLAVNQHLLTGKNLEFSSHYWMESAFIFVFAGLYCCQFLMYKFLSLLGRQPLRRILIGVALVWSWVAVSQSVEVAGASSPQDNYRQSYAPIFAWLKNNTAKDEVVFANQDLSAYLPIYTSNNVYFNQPCTLFYISDAEVQHRFAVQQYFNSLSDQDVVNNERSIWGTRYINKFAHDRSKNKLRKIFGLDNTADARIPPAEIARVQALLKQTKQLDFKTALTGWQADYLLWDKKNDPGWPLDRYDFLTELYADSGFAIYKIN